MIEYSQNYDISMVRGDTLPFDVEIQDYEGEVDDFAMTCRATPNAVAAIFKKDLEDGISVLDNTYTVRVAPEDTASLDPGVYYYDIQVTIDSDVFTPIKGKLYIDWDVTR